MRIKVRLILVLLVVSSNSFAQKLLDTGKVWNIMECHNQGTCLTNTWQLGVGDTTIGIQTYKRIIQTDSFPCIFHCEEVLMREDSSKKVYFYEPGGEFLMYDFNLLQGDTFRMDAGIVPSFFTFIVDSVDSIVLINGEKRKRIMFYSWHFETWIEGIGSVSGLFESFIERQVIDIFPTLLCFKENGVLNYFDSNYQTCFYTNLGIEDGAKNYFLKVFPNPVKDKGSINFSLSKNQNIKIEVVEITGRLVQTIADSRFNSGENKIEWDATELKPGIYFLKLEGENYSEKKKVVVMK